MNAPARTADSSASAAIDALYAQHVAELHRRTQEALDRGGFDHLVVPSGNLHYQFFDDRDYPYAVNPQFKAWLPLTRNPGSWLIATPGRKPTLIYLQPFDYWHVVPQAPSGYWVEHFDVIVIRKPDEALAHLPKDAARCAILGEPQSALGDYAPNNPQPVIDYLEYHRAYKTPYEVAMMREATRKGVRAHRAAETAFRAGLSEFDIHLAYCAAARQDAHDLPYGNIIALNQNGAVLHYMELDREAPAQSRSFLIDAGASHHGYACDITRAYASDARDEFQALIDAVDAAQLKMCDQVRAGTDYKRIHLDAHLALAGILNDFGVLKASPEAAVATGVSGVFFPHGIGHGIGLQVHEVAGFAASDRGGRIDKPAGHPYLRLTRVLEPGMAVTIEPGLYFVDLLLDGLRQGEHADSVDWSRIDRFRPFGGIRIEDDVVCTDAAPINLTRDEFAATA
ncbi:MULTISPECIES: Xaa-Pro dipeptidase [unclassified Lysobacter]|uniref:Xaa-Pro dipeptidase n=1 Tax=unclassified Lysobacter TaxID=2635362 RepID=UPI001BE7E630|nr:MULTISPECIES: Xaa-Pro dipeptidase [unclassified Lysobacter]MBT2748141.1 Xaa-Pro dipeptidase [Lysobacter sp. ISL-42]MBT2751052.1 Xaa-Pro dipeptidase [Lysobacter sp. ISL-50]MBT2776899.1 Xaa-Pro dipeptidase [Lysobacter sp. ISL-54]MBT2783368.1 Xaa-Pro dipeptidase [Lysobacter sp. ISL-52]